MMPPPYAARQHAAALHEETEIVWRQPARSARWRVPALCSAAALLVGLGLGYAIWGGESAPARAGSSDGESLTGARSSADTSDRSEDRERAEPRAARATADEGAEAAGTDEGAEAAGTDEGAEAATADEGAEPRGARAKLEPAGGAASVETGCAVSLTSVPAEAAVFVGGERAGETPVELELPCGEVEFEFRRSRYRSLKRTAVLSAGEPSSLAVRLRRPKFRLKLTSRPSGAKVSIDGKRKGVTPLSVKLSGYTYHNVVVKKSGYRTYRKRIYPRGNSSVRARLSRRR